MKRITSKILVAFCLIFGVIFANLSIFSPILPSQPTYAIGEDDPDTTTQSPESDSNVTPAQPSDITSDDNLLPNEPTDEYDPDAPLVNDLEQATTGKEGTTEEDTSNTCSDQAGSLSWIVCPATELLGNIIDGVYNIITDFLVVKPITTDTSSPIYIIWQYTRSLTNIIFIIFLLIVIISQITGLGISNYGVKRALPRLIIAVVLVNLSYLVCSLAVDASNIIGSSLTGFLGNIQTDIMEATQGTSVIDVSIASVITAILTGTTIAGLAISFIGGTGYGFFMILFFVIGGVISVASGLITLAARQALIALLVMIAPLAFVAYLLPNTEKWFSQWKNLFIKMLIFYPMFSLLYGASKLVGWTIIITASEPFGVVLGLAVQVFPLFFSWSLMKMSGTILNAVNTGVRKALSPVQKSLGTWSLEQAEHRRQVHFAKEAPMGSRLRSYLDYRRELRTNETKNAMEVRHDRAVSRAMIKSASVTGRDENGFTTREVNPNRYTRTAKSANFHHTTATSAIADYQASVSAYGDHFLDEGSQTLNNQAGQAFVDSFTRQLEAQNQAEADQKWLLDQFLTATTTQDIDKYDFNRLIGDAAGGLGPLGEATIMGQVIEESAKIEGRRRSQAFIVLNKFKFPKTEFRNMNLDMAHSNDNGYETNADGVQITDSMGNLIKYHKDGTPTHYQHEPYPYYIGIHKKTNHAITKEEYDALSEEERANYERVKYLVIPDDKGNPVQFVYDNDAGYMKEMFAMDAIIGDPVNLSYASELGVAHTANEKDGKLRRWHSVISKSLESYKDHDGTMTAMVLSQINNGFVTSRAQLNIARLQSLAVAAKTGKLITSDAIIINGITDLLHSAVDDEQFAYFFPDEDIDSYRNVNGIHLDGWRLTTDKQGREYWQEINHNNPSITVEDKKNFLKHKLFPKDANKIIGILNKQITQGASDNMKPDGLEALIRLRDTLVDMAKNHDGEDVDFEDRFNVHKNNPDIPDKNILESPDPYILKGGIRAAQQELGIDPSSGSVNPYRRASIDQLEQREARRQEAELRRIRRNSYETIHESIQGFFDYITDYDLLADQLTDYISETECLSDHANEFNDLIEKYRYDDRPDSLEDAIHDMSHRDELEQNRINQLRLEFEEFLNTRIDYEG